MTDDATYRKMKQERDLALAECERLRADAERLDFVLDNPPAKRRSASA